MRREQREAFVTVDGLSIESCGHPLGNAANQSLPEAVVSPGGTTVAHLHRRTEEIYLFTGGSGRMQLGEERRPVRAGDCVVIPPGASTHKLWADEQEPLVLLCCCSPAYSHEDTVLLED